MTDRKYRQSGYQDDDNADRSARGRPRREPGEGPRGRGLGAPTASLWKCSRCGSKVTSPPSPEAVCDGCGGDLHTCTNCRHFDSSAPMECRRPLEIRIPAKANRNDCDHFEPKLVQAFDSESSSGETAAGAKAAFDDLFNF